MHGNILYLVQIIQTTHCTSVHLGQEWQPYVEGSDIPPCTIGYHGSVQCIALGHHGQVLARWLPGPWASSEPDSGPQGPQGPRGPAGSVGPTGLRGAQGQSADGVQVLVANLLNQVMEACSPPPAARITPTLHPGSMECPLPLRTRQTISNWAAPIIFNQRKDLRVSSKSGHPRVRFP